MSNDWDNGNPFAPDEERHPDFFHRAAKYIVSSGAVPPEPEPSAADRPGEPAAGPPRVDPQDWDRPRSVVPQAAPALSGQGVAADWEHGLDPDQEQPAEEPLYTDDHGVPMLFDVVIPGDDCRAAGLFLPRNPPRQPRQAREPAAAPPPPATPSVDEIEARIQQAIDSALPHVTEVAASLLRDSLSEEIRRSLKRRQED